MQDLFCFEEIAHLYPLVAKMEPDDDDYEDEEGDVDDGWHDDYGDDGELIPA